MATFVNYSLSNTSCASGRPALAGISTLFALLLREREEYLLQARLAQGITLNFEVLLGILHETKHCGPREICGGNIVRQSALMCFPENPIKNPLSSLPQ